MHPRVDIPTFYFGAAPSLQTLDFFHHIKLFSPIVHYRAFLTLMGRNYCLILLLMHIRKPT